MVKHDLKKYKLSKVLTEHLEAILLVVNLSIKGLSHFRIYVPVNKILVVLEEQKKVLELHYGHQKKIKETKGKLS